MRKTQKMSRFFIVLKIQVADAFMRGLIEINGNLSSAIHARNIWNIFLTCMDYLAENVE